ncbi:MAG: peptide ABC transporter substrate-binding protein [Deltaproteobacteria bacterium]|nr:peptide ABC transporter substrate-binding protein [Deltaproteobacteria bacterium]
MKRTFFTLLALATLLSSTALAAPQALTLHGRDEPETLDPNRYTDIPGHNILMNIFEGLTRSNPKTLEAEPAMAQAWTISPDGKTYTFKLRPGIVWSDGKPITATDFVYGWQRVLNPATASKSAWQLYAIKNAEEYNTGKIADFSHVGVKALNPQTLQVTLENPAGYFLQLTTMPVFAPIRKDVVEKFGDLWIRPENIVTNGPFNLTTHVEHKEIVLTKNPKYWDAKNVKLEQVKFLPVPDYETALKMYDSNQLDTVFELPAVKIPELQTRPDMVKGPYLLSMYYYLNFKVPPLDDVRVRKALNYAIDRNVITEKILRKGDIPTPNYTPPGLPGYTPPPGFSYDPEKARQLLKEAGYGPGGKPLMFEILYNTTDEHKLVAQAIQNMWKTNLGIDVTLRNEEWKVYTKSRETGSFQTARAGWIGDYVDPNTFLELFRSTSGLNQGKYLSAEYDRMLDAAQAEVNPAKRLALFRDAEAKLLDDAAIIPLYCWTNNQLVKPYVKGYYSTLLNWHPLYRAYVER